MGGEQVKEFLDYLALKVNVAPNTQKIALYAFVFLYRHALLREFGDFSDFHRARSPKKLSVESSLDL